MQPLELATFIAKKLKAGEKKKTIAAKLKLDPSLITNLLSLIDAPPFLLELYHNRKCRTPKYLYELRRLHERNPEIIARRCAEAAAIERKFIDAIQLEVTPAAKPSPPPPADAVNASAEHGVSASNGDTGKMATVDTARLTTPTKRPSNNEVNNASTHTPAIPAQLQNPLLVGKYQRLEVMLVLTHCPTSDGLVMIRFMDGTGEAEVPINDVILTRLTEAEA